MQIATAAVDRVLAYHRATKHHFHRYALGPGGLDWASQPDPFRRYEGAPLVPLDRETIERSPRFDDAFEPGRIRPAPLTRASVSRLFYDSLALSAWKQLGPARWALRVNPSSGNLHPTEGYLVAGPVEGISDGPAVFHYAPKEHALELRAALPEDAWRALAGGLSGAAILVGLTSIHWREAWKYGERAYRYCQHDAGHAIAAVRIAAAGLGWRAALVDDASTDEVATLLGVRDPRGAEPEHPDCLLAVYVEPGAPREPSVAESAVAAFAALEWLGRPNLLSPSHLDWPAVDAVAEEARKPRTRPRRARELAAAAAPSAPRDVALRPTLHRRRSAVAMDGSTWMDRADFYRILERTIPARDRAPFDALWWEPAVHLGLFVHRVRGLEPGLYLLCRGEGAAPRVRSAIGAIGGSFEWARPEGCPGGLDLVRLARGDARALAAEVSCGQAIAADGCFAVAMLAELEPALAERGAWFYPRLYWECGAVGQVLYLEAEAAGVRSTGIGCFFDDPTHELFGVETEALQSLYHFTVGGAVEDPRLTTLPPYPER